MYRNDRKPRKTQNTLVTYVEQLQKSTENLNKYIENYRKHWKSYKKTKETIETIMKCKLVVLKIIEKQRTLCKINGKHTKSYNLKKKRGKRSSS